MVRVEVADNVTRAMVDVLSPAIERTEDLRIAVAFASKRGLELIAGPLATAVGAGAPVEFLVGLDFRTTEPRALEDLLALSRTNRRVSTYWFASLSDAGIYHPKLYISRVDDGVTSIVGSSNLTEGGLKRNVEVNIVVSAVAEEEIVSDIYMAYNRLKFHHERVEPDEEFLGLYTELFEAEKRDRRKARRDPGSRKLREAFGVKATSLRRPRATARDLVGWLELVYDLSPDGEFTNADLYEREDELRRRYPLNLNVKAKVRQQLQLLRDMGFVEHVSSGRWRKL